MSKVAYSLAMYKIYSYADKTLTAASHMKHKKRERYFIKCEKILRVKKKGKYFAIAHCNRLA